VVVVTTILHLLRAGAPRPPAEALGPGDRILWLDDVASDMLIDLVMRYERVIVW
jgi:hypothetical protein